MEHVSSRPARVDLTATVRPHLSAAGAWLVPFVLVLYLALKGGGYDPLVHRELGVAVWWIVLLGALVGALPAGRVGRASWVGLGLLGAFAVWTALASGWSQSSEDTANELARVASYVGFLALAVSAQRRGTVRPILHGTACAIATVAGLAVLSRLHPAWFPANQTAAFLPGASSRLGYPINYWNGLGALVAMGLPLMLGIATSARTLAGRAVAAGALPAMVWCVYLTLSRGGALAAAVATLAFLALTRDRLVVVATALVAGAGGAILILATTQRGALAQALDTASAHRQGSEMLAMGIVVCAGVALLCAAIGLAARYGREPVWAHVPRRRGRALLAAAVAVAVLAAVGAGAPGALSTAWQNFKNPTAGLTAGRDLTPARYGTTSGKGRYQLWTTAKDGAGTDLLKGTGPGTFQQVWARNGPFFSYVVNAHSLYFETLAETGIVGLALILAFLVTVLGTGVMRTLRAAAAERAVLAAATGACAGFCISAGVDWIWQIPVLPIAFFVLAGVLLASRSERPRTGGRRLLAARAALAVGAVAAVLAIVPPLAGDLAVRESQAQAAAKRLGPALSDVRVAERLRPGAAGPRLQEALVLEQAGSFDAAARAAGAATTRGPNDWHNWFIRARIEGERGNSSATLAYYRRARSLNPHSALFFR